MVIIKLTLKQATLLIKYARRIIEDHFRDNVPNINDFISKDMQDIVSRESAVFLTLMKYPSMSIRGSTGHILPILSLGDAIRESAIEAAFKSIGRPPLTKSELNDTIMELSILKRPSMIKVKNIEEYPKMINIGRDGIAVERGYIRVLLLPQIPVIRRWNSRQFLSFALIKAGINPLHINNKVRIYKFQAQVFREKTPDGEVIEIT